VKIVKASTKAPSLIRQIMQLTIMEIKKNKGLFSRVTIVNVAILAQLWFVIEIVDVSKEFIKYVEKQVFSYIWKGTEVLARNLV
jgi:hypothetical protein